MFDHIPHRHDVECGVGMRLPQVTKTCVSPQAAGLASMLSCIGVRFDTHGSDAVLTRDLAQTAHTGAEIKQLLPCKRPQFSFRLVKCLSQYLFGSILVRSDTRIRGGIVELLVGRAESQVIKLRKSEHQRA